MSVRQEHTIYLPRDLKWPQIEKIAVGELTPDRLDPRKTLTRIRIISNKGIIDEWYEDPETGRRVDLP